MMNRPNWLKALRRETEEHYDTLWAPLYAEKWGIYSNTSHLQFLQKFISLLPQPCTILDAACGAGRYLSMLLEKSRAVIGIDQSKGMLSRAREKFPTVQFEKTGLQEMHFQQAFDGAICMDAMENVFPEDWPLVLRNFYRALKPQGVLYFTVEVAAEEEIEQAFVRGQKAGFPIVFGEWPDQEGYHFYPSIQQVREWIGQAGFNLLEDGEGDDYHHFILRKAFVEP
jgi:ubiquinone/menaquinone biosynthesis C-methylase UbiE